MSKTEQKKRIVTNESWQVHKRPSGKKACSKKQRALNKKEIREHEED